MEHFRAILASLLCMVAIFGVLAFFAVSSHSNVTSASDDLCTDSCQYNSPVGLSPDSALGNAPTLAPPRNNSASDPLSRQAVFVRVESSQSEIEVGWFNAETIER